MAEHPQTHPAPSKPGAYPRGPERSSGARIRHKLSSNENPLGASPAAVAAIQAAAEGLWEYPPFLDDELRSALAAHHGRGLTPDHFVTGNSGCDVLNLIARAFLVPGDEAVICRPTFPIYETTARAAGATIVPVDLPADTFRYDVDALLAAVTPATRLLYLCSPNNPTGILLSAQQWAGILAGLPERVIIVFDEVYYHFITAADRPDPLADAADGANVLVVHSFSKAYGLAGLRLGYAAGKPELVAQAAALRLPFHINALCFAAGLAALKDDAHVARTVEVTLAGRDWLYGQLRELGLEAWPSQANFVLFRCPTSAPAAAWAEKLQGHGILVRPAFGLPDCLRVSVGLPEANQAFIDALGTLLE